MKLVFSILLLSLSISIFSQTQIQQATQILQDRGEIVIRFNVATKDQINNDLTKIMSIDNVKPSHDGGFDVIAYANAREFQTFLTRNIPYQIIPKDASKALTMATTVAQMATWDKYPTYSVYEQMMASFASTYPTLCNIDTIMASTPSGNYKILVARISDNVNTAENEPQFLYSSSMHGDETTGFYLMLRMIEYLLSNYGSVSQVTSLVSGAEIWICPMANPEGTYYNSSPVGSTIANSIRGNLSGVDLNRNYKDPVDGDHPDGNAWQPETQAFMTFADNHHFNMGGNFHGGAEVMNYPWDNWTTASNPNADAPWWERVCTDYVTTARAITSGYMTDTFGDGVTEGGDWYLVAGGRQDYMNYFHQCREATIELDGVKTTETENLNGMWNTNYQSLLDYMEESLYGIRGLITDSCSGMPIRAKVFANSYDQANDSSHVYSALPVGNYHKYVNTGTYSITYSAPGYTSKTITNIAVTNGTATTRNVVLVPLTPVANFAADVTSTCTGMVQFSNTGTYPAGCSFLWSFGDGQTSTLENPQHAYASNGTFTVQLTINACAGSDSETKSSYVSVNMPTAPTATGATRCGSGSVALSAAGGSTLNWYTSAIGGTAVGTGTTFNTPSISTTTTYYVASESVTIGAAQHTGMTDNTGGGQYFTSTNAYRYMIFDVMQPIRLESVKVYVNTVGSRTIYLQNSAGTTLDSVVVNIPTAQNPYLVTLDFDIPVGTGYRLGLKTGTGNNLYIGSNPSYPYTIANTISITGNNQNQSYFYFFFDWIVKTNETCSSARTAATATIYQQPVASFSAIVNGNSADFTSTSTNAVAYSWNFGDGQTSTMQNPDHIYASTGTYIVTLIVTGTGSCSPDTTTQQIIISNAPYSDFSASQFCVGSTTLFSDQSSVATGSITSWAWDFGDGSATSTTQNPAHTYADSGLFNVTLIVVSNLGFSDTSSQQIYIESRPTAAFDVVTGAPAQTTAFTDQSDGNGSTLANWIWNFGDGSTSVQQNPDHVYSGDGTYWVTLIVSNGCGSDTIMQQVVIIPDGISEAENHIKLFPNPVQDDFITLEFTTHTSETYQIRIFGTDGKLNTTQTFEATSGENRCIMNLEYLSKGVYWIELSSGSTVHRIQFVK
ncbi:MAG: hypothetical protein A2W93_12460 [Bacteroidetes bacterium GWF2_43_63]|nr:MAG: hypothetical protein A2W94_06855 [Bacteroidetes bacterium GWE2_42_42]OFY56478.1 MAG: hypothetical protein A2W93_12460 [Bacteroidetes bacterium GWF2_43_63]HBG71176.1 hypothetical protein [Bacteroidales bacterium]HCB61259.1 hypothetical protein [Bacteroidales bacterium]HCY23276.1 hypothetical protein [Bacteroidales bacterium]